MAKLFPILVIMVWLGGCQNQTGTQWLDKWVVSDYEDRIQLTLKLKDSSSYCELGCMEICLMSPEPKIYFELAEKLANQHTNLQQQADSRGLLLDLPEPTFVLSLRDMHPIPESEVGPMKLECLRQQEANLQQVEALLKNWTDR